MTEQVSSSETRVPPISLTKSSLKFMAIDGDEIDDSLVNSCAKLFSTNYGIWGESAGPSLAGKRVRMTARKLREQCLPIPQSSVLAVCFGDTELLGHAFATVWKYDGGTVGWITQLVVSAPVRRRYIATQLLQIFKRHTRFKDVTAIGLASSHPGSIAALAKYGNVPIDKIDLKFMSRNALNILHSTPISYLRDVKPCGALFEEDCTTKNVSSLFTQFYVDHREPLDALNVFKANDRWCLGDLPGGHEFLIIIPVGNL